MRAMCPFFVQGMLWSGDRRGKVVGQELQALMAEAATSSAEYDGFWMGPLLWL